MAIVAAIAVYSLDLGADIQDAATTAKSTTLRRSMMTTESTPVAIGSNDQLGAWQPVSTAPRDVCILLYGAKRTGMVVGMNHGRDGWVIDTPSEWASMYPPTHWMPLPAPPQSA